MYISSPVKVVFRHSMFCGRRFCVLVAMIAAWSVGAGPARAGDGCLEREWKGAQYIVCGFNAASADIRLFLNDETDAPFRHFGKLKKALAAEGLSLQFAMNGGMYHDDRSPVGLYLEGGQELKRANTNPGPGNFHMLPNGVFFVGAKEAGVLETKSYLNRTTPARHATQSGPMLVIDGALHPRFLEDGESKKRRNGVGVTDDGEIYFVLSDDPVNFYDFASLFRDALSVRNALYLDGTISRIYAPDLDRMDPGVGMGPIIGVVAARE